MKGIPYSPWAMFPQYFLYYPVTQAIYADIWSSKCAANDQDEF
jgi:hypothetical protein